MKTIISVDLGATNVRVGLIDEKLTIIEVIREHTVKADKAALYSQIKNMISHILNKIPENCAKPTIIGIDACGIVDHNYIVKLPNLFIEHFDLQKKLEADFPLLRCYISNDANCAAFTEATYGAAIEAETSFFITISSGIGGCLVYNRELVDLPFEIGHMTFNYRDTFYEIEQLLSGNGLINLAKLYGLNISGAAGFFALVEKEDELTLKVYREWIKLLGIFISNLQLMFSCDVFVLSGGVMKSEKLFIADLIRATEAFVTKMPVKPIVFKMAKFDQDAGLIGGAGLALRQLE